MNSGTYPNPVINEAVKRMNQGANPKDVADELREKYQYDKLHWKTVGRWYRKYPLGKEPKSLPPQIKEEIRRLVRGHGSEHRPTSPLQEEAWERCQQTDHRWMADERFVGHAYRQQVLYGTALIAGPIPKMPAVVSPLRGAIQRALEQKPEVQAVSQGRAEPRLVDPLGERLFLFYRETPEGIAWSIKCEVRTCFFCDHPSKRWSWPGLQV